MSDDEKQLLKRLVDAPYGQAKHILKSEGHWDEHGAEDGEPRQYRVRVAGEMQCWATVKVVARSEDEACEMAEKIASDRMFEWRDFGGAEVQYAEIADE